MNRRSQELANDLARRAIAAAERQRRADQPDADLADRLAAMADTDGRVTVDDALVALTGGTPQRPADPLAGLRAREAEKGRAAHERLFGTADTSSDDGPEVDQ